MEAGDMLSEIVAKNLRKIRRFRLILLEIRYILTRKDIMMKTDPIGYFFFSLLA